MALKRETIIIIGNDERTQSLIRKKFKRDYQLKIASSYKEASKITGREIYDYIFLDLDLPKNKGEEVVEQGGLGAKLFKTLKEESPLIPIITIYDPESAKIVVELLKYGMVDLVCKDDLNAWLESLQKKKRTLKDISRQNKILRHENLGKPAFESLIVKSKTWDKIKTAIIQVAPTGESVLITGETGTGKELIAREIVKYSDRKNAVYLRLNIFQVSNNLLDSELFGYEKGAFTGAESCKIGIFEAAHNGTVLLDEIGDISIEMQVKLLRFLEEKEFRRVGSNKVIRVNVRIIAATSRNLEQMIEEGKFRLDLYYRLNRFGIHVTPLRKRKEDIEPLVRHFIKKYCTRYNKRKRHLSNKSLDLLKLYEWPGNVRELENVVSKSVLLSKSSTLNFEDFNLKIPEDSPEIFENVKSSKIDKYGRAHVCPEKTKNEDIPKTAKSYECKEALSPEQQQILDHIQSNGFISNKVARQKFGVVSKTIVVWCNDLIERGLIDRVGIGKSVKYVPS